MSPTVGGEALNTEQAALCAHGEHELQAALHEHLGSAWGVDGGFASVDQSAPHPILFGGVTLEPEASGTQLADVGGPVCDSFAVFTPEDMPGREADTSEMWMVRDAGLPAVEMPELDGVQIREAASMPEVERWEAVSLIANGAERGETGALHPAASLGDPRLRFLQAEADGEVVGTALGMVGTETLTVSTVRVMPEARGRGIGRALTAAVLQLSSSLPATLSAMEMGRGIYQRLGFQDVGRPAHWTPVPAMASLQAAH